MFIHALVMSGMMTTGYAASPPPIVAPVGQTEDTLAWLARRVADLDLDDLAAREAAALEVASDPRTNLALLERYLARAGDSNGTLSAEQRECLTRLAVGLFKAEPRGAMGVSFAGFDAAEGVEILSTVEGFDARRVLRAGDIIRTMDGMPVRFNQDARAVILSHDPGDALVMEIVRGGEVQTVTMTLGAFSELRNAAEPNDLVLATAWEIRCARRAGAMATAAPVLESGLEASRWASLTMARRPLPAPGRAGLPRGWNQADVKPDVPRVAAGGEHRGVPVEIDLDFAARNLMGDHPHQANIMAQISDLSRRIMNGEARLRAGNLNAATRRNLIAQLERERSLRDQFREQLKRLRNADPPKDPR
ncbi:MAG: hypothetical protein HBSAPP03_21280 [Phycisphaerae bacterium]|nr:MAG: hypothetical protein HBSAPP03_21280 [Phycisphaerae bacterium]